ncbi:MAG: FtsX-like permease family protein [Candidatus Dojkabacteria bacterium]|nr:FtsX-like permease family protein [Candidatus Dojkabacteria bacterium]
MKFYDLLATSFRNLFRQKARTVLTVISMMIGAFLIAIMMSVGNGLKQFMVSQVTLFANTSTIAVQANVDFAQAFGMSLGGGVAEFEEESPQVQDPAGEGQNDSVNGVPDFLSEAFLDQEDLEKLQEIDGVSEAAFETYVTPDYIRLAEDESPKLLISMYGVPSGIRDRVKFSSVDRALLERDDAIVLSDSYAEAWNMDREDLVGETVLVRMTQTGDTGVSGMGMGMTGNIPSDAGEQEGPGEPLRQEFELVVAGLFEKSIFSQISFITPQQSDILRAFVSGQELSEFSEEEQAFEIIVVAEDDDQVDAVDRRIEDLGYQSSTFDEAVGQIGVVFDILGVALSGFGAIAMLVASIGIANTLLMAIYERTREIGVMKAVGATRSTIGLLFTMEAAWLGIIGGTVGLLFTKLFGDAVNFILHEGISIGSATLLEGFLADYPTFDVSVFSIGIVLLVLGVTAGVAIVAGLYPAWRASRLDPVVALSR